MKLLPFALPSFLPAGAARAPVSGQHALRRHSVLAIDRPLGRRVDCASGSVWLTFDGCRQDFFLEAGQSLACHEAGRLLVSALRESTVCVD